MGPGAQLCAVPNSTARPPVRGCWAARGSERGGRRAAPRGPRSQTRLGTGPQSGGAAPPRRGAGLAELGNAAAQLSPAATRSGHPRGTPAPEAGQRGRVGADPRGRADPTPRERKRRLWGAGLAWASRNRCNVVAPGPGLFPPGEDGGGLVPRPRAGRAEARALVTGNKGRRCLRGAAVTE